MKLEKFGFFLIAFLMGTLMVFGQGQDSIRAVGGVLTINLVPSSTRYKVFVDQTIISTVFTNPIPAAVIAVLFVQDSTGHTVAFGGNISGACSVSATASATTGCQFTFDAANNQWTGIGGGGANGPGGPSYILASNSGVVGNGKFCADGTVTSGSPNISSAGQCQWTSADVGSLIFVTNACTQGAQCGFVNLPLSQTILPSTQTKIARIASVTDATHIVTDCNSPGNCVSPNASATNTGAATIFYAPTKQTAAINAAYAAQQTTTGCPVLIYPQGMILFDGPIWNTLPANTSCAVTLPNIHSLQEVLNQNGGGPTIKGSGGMNGTIFVASPDFNFAACPGSICIGGTFVGGDYEDMTITGLGQNFASSGFNVTGLINCNNCILRNVTLSGWMNRVGGSPGITSSIGFMYLDNVQIIGFGGVAGCIQTAGDMNILKSVISGFCAGPALTGNSGSNVQSSNSAFYGGNIGNTPQIDTTGITTWQSSNDRIFGNNVNTSASDDIKIANGTTAVVTNFFNTQTGAFSNGLHVFNGGTLRLSGYHTSGGKNKGLTVDAGGTFSDLGGNDSTYGSTTNNCAGTCFGADSQIATTSAATNFGVALTAQTVDGFAPTGPTTVNLTINQSLAGVGCGAGSNTATPTLSWTAPGGTAKTLALTALSISANGAVDTVQNDTSSITAQPGTAITYTTASTLASAGCSTVPQYTVFAKVTQ